MGEAEEAGEGEAEDVVAREALHDLCVLRVEGEESASGSDAIDER